MLKKALNKPFAGIVVIAALFLLSSCGKPKDLKFGEIHDIKVKNFSLVGVDLEAVVPVQNPNSYPITVKDADMNLLADDKPIAHITQTSPPITLAGNSSADHTVGINISLVNKADIMGMMNLFSGKSALNLDGTIKLSSLVFSKTVVVHQTNVQEYLKPVMDKLHLF